MRTYTLHLPAGATPGDPDGLDRADLVRDGFSWGAFFFTVLWFFAHRLWLAGLGVLVALVVLVVLCALLSVVPGAAFLAWLLASLLVGLEANSLRRWTYSRRGRPAVGVVTAVDEEEAALKAFATWLGPRDLAAAFTREPSSAATRPAYARSEGVIGLFPDPEHGR
jgi:hypothetical protein